jgi:hypothetical protein
VGLSLTGNEVGESDQGDKCPTTFDTARRARSLPWITNDCLRESFQFTHYISSRERSTSPPTRYAMA